MYSFSFQDKDKHSSSSSSKDKDRDKEKSRDKERSEHKSSSSSKDKDRDKSSRLVLNKLLHPFYLSLTTCLKSHFIPAKTRTGVIKINTRAALGTSHPHPVRIRKSHHPPRINHILHHQAKTRTKRGAKIETRRKTEKGARTKRRRIKTGKVAMRIVTKIRSVVKVCDITWYCYQC